MSLMAVQSKAISNLTRSSLRRRLIFTLSKLSKSLMLIVMPKMLQALFHLIVANLVVSKPQVSAVISNQTEDAPQLFHLDKSWTKPKMRRSRRAHVLVLVNASGVSQIERAQALTKVSLLTLLRSKLKLDLPRGNQRRPPSEN